MEILRRSLVNVQSVIKIPRRKAKARSQSLPLLTRCVFSDLFSISVVSHFISFQARELPFRFICQQQSITGLIVCKDLVTALQHAFCYFVHKSMALPRHLPELVGGLIDRFFKWIVPIDG